jgi:hypothetical protein
MSLRRVLARLAPWSVAVAVAAVALLVVPARAEGPGYDGAADSLAVVWASADDAVAPSDLPRTGPAPDSPALRVSGVGFRARSEVQVRVGSGASVVVRVDETGTLRTAVAPGTGEAAGTGVSVVATGRAPSGTSKTLVGSIPARAAGTGPVDLVPWLVLGIGVVALATWLLPRLSWRAPGGSDAGSGLDVLAER